jgi:hypothetical protein
MLISNIHHVKYYQYVEEKIMSNQAYEALKQEVFNDPMDWKNIIGTLEKRDKDGRISIAGADIKAKEIAPGVPFSKDFKNSSDKTGYTIPWLASDVSVADKDYVTKNPSDKSVYDFIGKNVKLISDAGDDEFNSAITHHSASTVNHARNNLFSAAPVFIAQLNVPDDKKLELLKQARKANVSVMGVDWSMPDNIAALPKEDDQQKGALKKLFRKGQSQFDEFMDSLKESYDSAPAEKKMLTPEELQDWIKKSAADTKTDKVGMAGIGEDVLAAAKSAVVDKTPLHPPVQVATKEAGKGAILGA